MSKDSYERLIDALDALPGRFPRTPSRVELRLLRKAFTRDEVELTAHITRKYESVADIAARAGVTVEKAKRLLRDCCPRTGQGAGC